MKKFITVVALFLSFTASADWMHDTSFDNWDITHSSEGSWAGNQVVSDGTSATLYMNHNGTVNLSYNPGVRGGMGKVKQTWRTVIDVNGRAVKFVGTEYTSGYMTFDPQTKDGQEFVKKQALDMNTVMFTFSDGWWASFNVKGAKKAWEHLKKTKAI